MAAAPFGSSLILPISYAYIALMGSEGLTEVCAPRVWPAADSPRMPVPLGCARRA